MSVPALATYILGFKLEDAQSPTPVSVLALATYILGFQLEDGSQCCADQAVQNKTPHWLQTILLHAVIQYLARMKLRALQKNSNRPRSTGQGKYAETLQVVHKTKLERAPSAGVSPNKSILSFDPKVFLAGVQSPCLSTMKSRAPLIAMEWTTMESSS